MRYNRLKIQNFWNEGRAKQSTYMLDFLIMLIVQYIERKRHDNNKQTLHCYSEFAIRYMQSKSLRLKRTLNLK